MLLLGYSATTVFALDGREIMAEIYRTALSRNLRYEGAVHSVSASGEASDKRWLVERKGSPGKGRILLRFEAPAEVKGVALLIKGNPGQAPEQWLYTPATRRARRVAPQSRNARFYATDLSFEDFEEGDIDAFEFRMAGEDRLAGDPCWRIEARPRRVSAYETKTIWVSQSRKTVLRSDHFVNGAAVKRIEYQGHRNLQGIWTPARVVVTDLREGGRTEIRLENVKYDVPLPDARFTVEALSSEGL